MPRLTGANFVFFIFGVLVAVMIVLAIIGKTSGRWEKMQREMGAVRLVLPHNLRAAALRHQRDRFIGDHLLAEHNAILTDRAA